jgi:hypothetical protein
MTEERKADLEAKLAELEHEIWLAAKQGALPVGADCFKWQKVILTDDTVTACILTVLTAPKKRVLHG